MPRANRDNILSFFLIWIPLISSFLIIIWIKPPEKIWNRDSKNGSPCLVLDLREKTFNVLLVSMMLHVDFCRCSQFEQISFYS